MLRSPIYIDVTQHDHSIPTTKPKSLLIPPRPSTALTLSVLQSLFHPEPAILDVDFVEKCLSMPQLIDEYVVVHSEPSPVTYQTSRVMSNPSNPTTSYKITVPKHLRITRNTKHLPVYLQLDVPVLSRVKSIHTLSSPLLSRPISPITGPVIPLSPVTKPVTQTNKPTESIIVIHPDTLSRSNVISKPPLKKPQSKPWK